MAYLRSDIVTEVRDNLYETTADLWTDAQLVKHLRAEIRSLPRKGLYLEELEQLGEMETLLEEVTAEMVFSRV